jgi:hypothetical protein
MLPPRQSAVNFLLNLDDPDLPKFCLGELPCTNIDATLRDFSKSRHAPILAVHTRVTSLLRSLQSYCMGSVEQSGYLRRD